MSTSPSTSPSTTKSTNASTLTPCTCCVEGQHDMCRGCVCCPPGAVSAVVPDLMPRSRVAAERDAALAEVARLREGIEGVDRYARHHAQRVQHADLRREWLDLCILTERVLLAQPTDAMGGEA